MNLSYMLLALQVLQVLSALGGALMTFRAKVDADKSELVVLRASMNGSRRIIARKNARIENVILLVQLSLLVTGVVTLSYGIMPPEHPDVLIVMGFRSLDMTFISVVLAWLSYHNWVVLMPIMALRKEDVTQGGLASVVAGAAKAQELAGTAQVAAAGAQTAASSIEDTAKNLIEEKQREEGL